MSVPSPLPTPSPLWPHCLVFGKSPTVAGSWISLLRNKWAAVAVNSAVAEMSFPPSLCHLDIDGHRCSYPFSYCLLPLGNESGGCRKQGWMGRRLMMGYWQDEQVPFSFGEHTSLRWALTLVANESWHPSCWLGHYWCDERHRASCERALLAAETQAT